MTPSKLAETRACLSYFTPARPLFVPPVLFSAMCRTPGLDDMMDRVREQRPVGQ